MVHFYSATLVHYYSALDNLIDDTGLSRRFIVTTLDLLEGDLWDLEKGPNNSKNYSLRTNVNPDKVEGDEDVMEYLIHEGYFSQDEVEQNMVEYEEEDEKEYLIREGHIPRDEDLYPITTC